MQSGQIDISQKQSFNNNNDDDDKKSNGVDEDLLKELKTNINGNKRKEKYGKGEEAKIIKEELGDFNVSESKAYKEIYKKFGRSIRFSELLGILNSINIYLQIKKNISLPHISRNEKRSYPLLIKYIERNGEMIFPYLQYISLCNSSFQKIPVDNV